MKKKHQYWMVIVIVTVVVAVNFTALVTPTAADNKMLIGERINLDPQGETTYPANEPFHIVHYWIFYEGDSGIGLYDFTLDIDGILQPEDFIDSVAKNEDGITLVRSWAFNFPEGMTGEHSFTGHWFAPCMKAVEFFDYPGPCRTPITKIEVGTRTLTVTFIP